ncbi:hypothetical protein SDC9_64203 [bioreactor metagenome]|uniref:Uncharacterized protein n=1 Tax=bioreactor metagenome TaxID=1076179 RepID=A0A644XUL0_9ZZZZ|nr:sulfite exporter TauE/SafE family protein [Candidatus Metalachnospira sp.]
MILLAFIGFLSGIISGMGIGGGTILIPALVMLTDMSQQSLQGINLIYFIPTAVIALITHLKNNNVEKSVVKPIVLYGIFGAIVGSFAAVAIDSEILRKIFAVFLVVMGICELRKR